MNFFDKIKKGFEEFNRPLTVNISTPTDKTEISCPKCGESKLRNSGMGIINLYCPKCDYRFNGDDNDQGSSASGLLIQ